MTKTPEQIEAEKETAFRAAFANGQLQVDVLLNQPISDSVMRWGEARGYCRHQRGGNNHTTWRLTTAGRKAMAMMANMAAKKALPPQFRGALDDAAALAATFEDVGMVMWICDRGAGLDFPARTYGGNLSGAHVLAAVDAIVNLFGSGDHPPKVARAFREITAALRKGGVTMDSFGASPIKPAAKN